MTDTPTKTPEEIINGHIKWMLGSLSTHGFRANTLIKDLDAAGYVIVPKENVVTAEALTEALGKQVDEIIAAAQNEESPPPVK